MSGSPSTCGNPEAERVLRAEGGGPTNDQPRLKREREEREKSACSEDCNYSPRRRHYSFFKKKFLLVLLKIKISAVNARARN